MQVLVENELARFDMWVVRSYFQLSELVVKLADAYFKATKHSQRERHETRPSKSWLILFVVRLLSAGGRYLL